MKASNSEIISLSLAAVSLLIGILLEVFGIPLWARRIEPNSYFGIRVRQTQVNSANWFEVNELAGFILTLQGLTFTCFSLILFILPSFTIEPFIILIILICLILCSFILFFYFIYKKLKQLDQLSTGESIVEDL
eukprot:TRINITY_DN591_c1_g1_i1.p1 TRINITY_DN591_c1_g1~~TRINITY_DN591_c1_g1_i1.p1  ORF type:complete len:134 (-),score=53.16 TRINITY_DN591_c1_g1_i1:59-460(-)